MDSRISQQANTGIKVQIESSRARQTPKTDFGSVMATGLERTGSAVMQAGQVAAPFIPGGAVLSGAISGVASLKASAAGQSAPLASSANGTSLVNTSATGSSATGGDQLSALAASGDPNAVMMAETRRMQELNQSFNLQYLQLQEKMQAENRQFTVLSNVMKTKHDTAKSAIGNIR
jgi:hypothetical protein